MVIYYHIDNEKLKKINQKKILKKLKKENSRKIGIKSRTSFHDISFHYISFTSHIIW